MGGYLGSRPGGGLVQALSQKKNILRILGADIPIKGLDFNAGLALVNELKARGRKVAYIRKHIRDLKATFNHQVATRYLEYNPFATLLAGKIPAEEKIQHRILTDAEIRKILEKARAKDGGPALNSAAH